MIQNVLQGTIVGLAVVSLFLLGRKVRAGWLVALTNEGVWLGYAFVLRSWGMVCLALIYGSMHTLNFVRWGREAETV